MGSEGGKNNSDKECKIYEMYVRQRTISVCYLSNSLFNLKNFNFNLYIN